MQRGAIGDGLLLQTVAGSTPAAPVSGRAESATRLIPARRDRSSRESGTTEEVCL